MNKLNRIGRMDFTKCVLHMKENEKEFVNYNISEAVRVLRQFSGCIIGQDTAREMYKAAGLEHDRGHGPTRTRTPGYSTSRILALDLVEIRKHLGLPIPQATYALSNGLSVDRGILHLDAPKEQEEDNGRILFQ